MKLALLVAILMAIGVGGLVMLISVGGAAQTVTASSLLGSQDSEQSGRPRRVSITVQVAEMHGHFQPIEFDGIDIPANERETQAETNRRFRESPRMRVVYHGHDKIPLERYNHVRMEGTWDPKAGVFVAEKLSTQCPSRYEAESTSPTVGS
jgi:hypothetical protein